MNSATTMDVAYYSTLDAYKGIGKYDGFVAQMPVSPIVAPRPRMEIVSGGDFETGDLAGWQVDSPDKVIGAATSASGVMSPQNGSFYCFLGDSSAVGSIRQTLATVDGQRYTVSFYLSHFNYGPAQDNEITITWGSALLLSSINAEDFPNTYFSFDVVATGANTEIAFAVRDATGGFGVDGVSVTPASASPFAKPAETRGLPVSRTERYRRIQAGWRQESEKLVHQGSPAVVGHMLPADLSGPAHLTIDPRDSSVLSFHWGAGKTL